MSAAYSPPDFQQGTRDGQSVPGQLVASLARSRRWGRTFAQAWPVACQNVKYPKEKMHRREWQRLQREPSFVEIFERAYERLPSRGDVTVLHTAIEPTAAAASIADCQLRGRAT